MTATPAAAHILTDSVAACHRLAQKALPLSALDNRIFGEARQLSGLHVPITLDSAQVIRQVAHLPHTPYLTAVAGQQTKCVAIGPAWWGPLTARERLWLVLVGKAGLGHPKTYHLMLRAGENTPSGLFSGLITWWAKKMAYGAILASERQATHWLTRQGGSAVAQHALVTLQSAPHFAHNSWLPSLLAQQQAVR